MRPNVTKNEMPYNSDVRLLDKILNDLKTASRDGIKVETLWADLDAKNNINRTYTLKLALYLGLVDTDHSKIWLTDLGTKLGHTAKDDKNKLLASNLPESYRTMVRWILNSDTLKISDIKIKFIDYKGRLSSDVRLARTIATFLNYCKYIGIIDYSGRGNKVKVSISEFGRKVMDAPTAINEQSNNDIINETAPPAIKPINLTTLTPESLLQQDATYPIKIITKDRVFDWDLRKETDFAVIDTVITSIKEEWKALHDKVSSSFKEDDLQ